MLQCTLCLIKRGDLDVSATVRIGQVPESPEQWYRPLAATAVGDVTFDLSPDSIPHVGDAVKSLHRGVLPSPHNAGLVARVPLEEAAPIDDTDLLVVDLLALELGRKMATVGPTDRNGVAKRSGRVGIEGAIAMTDLATNSATITHFVRSPSAWTRRAVPYLPAQPYQRNIKSLGWDAIQLEFLDSDPGAGIATYKRRVPVFHFARNIRSQSF